MFSGIPPVGITQNVRFLRCDTVLLGGRYVFRIDAITFYRIIRLTQTANIARISNKLSLAEFISTASFYSVKPEGIIN
jgi:hypothetical protein